MNTKITIVEAKNMDLIAYLAILNFNPEKIVRDDHWYLSPFRNEHTPSFKVSQKQQVWYDFGIGSGGNIIDFGILYFNCSVTEFLERLPGKNQTTDLSFHQQPIKPEKPVAPEEPKVKIKSIGRITSFFLIDYISSRSIPFVTASKYLKQVDLELNGKEIQVLGFKNSSGGFELRGAKNFKSSVSPKDFTLIENGKPALVVVEGMFDFLSLIDDKIGMVPEPTDWLVLNSLSFLEKAMETMDGYGMVYLMLDRDEAGKNCMKRLLSLSPKYQDLSHKYEDCKDPNEWLVKQKTHEVQQRRTGFRR